MNEIFDEVHVNLNVFVALMLNWIFGNLDGTLIIYTKGWSDVVTRIQTLKGSVEATRLPYLHLLLLDTLLLLKKVQYLLFLIGASDKS
jgi:hypothetical protein